MRGPDLLASDDIRVLQFAAWEAGWSASEIRGRLIRDDAVPGFRFAQSGLRDGSRRRSPDLTPRAGLQNVLQRRDRVEYIDVAHIERAEAEAHHVGRAEIADDAARDQRLPDAIALRVRERDVVAAPRAITQRR